MGKEEYPLSYDFNYTILLRKTSHLHLTPPYGHCSHYWPFGAKSHIECYRKCIQSQHKTRFKCIPLLIDNFVHELDFNSMDTKICLSETFAERERLSKEFREKCLTECPINCFDVEYHQKVIQTEEHFDNDQWFNETNKWIAIQGLNLKAGPDSRPTEFGIVWDSSEPMFAY